MAKRRVSHSVAGFQRAEVVRLDVGDDAQGSFGAIRFESLGHAGGVQPLASIVRMGESLVHIHVRGIEVQNEVIGQGDRGLSRIPAVARERSLMNDAVAAVLLIEGVLHESKAHLVLRIDREREKERPTQEPIGVSRTLGEGLRVRGLDRHRLEDPEVDQTIQGAHGEIVGRSQHAELPY